MKIKGVIFDFNGTLFFDSEYHNQIWKQIALNLRGSELSDEEMNERIHGKNNEKILDYISNHSLSQEEKTKWSKHKEELYRDLCRKHQDTTVLAPGVISFFETLQELQIPFTIASASIKENIDFYIAQFHLDEWMDISTITYDDGSYADKVEMFRQAAKNINCEIEECIIFEDSLSGFRFAHEAGAKKVIAIDALHEPQRYHTCPYVAKIYEDFTTIHIDDLIYDPKQ